MLRRSPQWALNRKNQGVNLHDDLLAEIEELEHRIAHIERSKEQMDEEIALMQARINAIKRYMEGIWS